jgi:hypothetical protein
MQGIYFMDTPLQVKKGSNIFTRRFRLSYILDMSPVQFQCIFFSGERLSIQTTHDDFAFWFDVRAENK